MSRQPLSHGTLRGILTHLLDVDIGWCRLFQHGTTDSFDVLQENSFATFATLHQRWHQQERVMQEYLAGLTESDLTRTVRYVDAGGFQGEWPLWHCLYHLANHGTQHRAEAAAILTDYGSSPGEMDFLAFRNQAGTHSKNVF